VGQTPHFLADGVDVSAADLVRPRHVVLKVHLLAQVHLARDRREDEPLLTPVWQRELYLTVQPTRSQQSRVQRVLSVGRHYNLKARQMHMVKP